LVPGDCDFNDHSDSLDNLEAILGWFEKYPEFKTNELFISGESYGGIYVPWMMYQIDQYNSGSTIFNNENST
jgi:serine carboxypeptidase-like clade 2